MNYFLMLVILAVCGGAYYEYTIQQQSLLANQQQINDLNTQISTLQADNKKLTDASAGMTKSLSDAQAKITTLTTQLQTIQKTTPGGTTPGNPLSHGTNPPKNSANNLGTVTTLDGRTFSNCVLLTVEADGITFNHTQGITKVLFPFLQPDMQKRFGYDPHVAAALTKAEIDYQEEKRKAADAAATPGK